MPISAVLQFVNKSHYRLLFVILLSTSVVALSFAYYVQYIRGLEPCPLCIYQRFPYLILIILSTLGLLVKQFSGYIILLVGIILLIACGIAGYHSGIERDIFTLPSSCAAAVKMTDNLSIDEIKQILYSKGIASCAKPALVVFGLSMTEWNLLWNIAVLVIVVLAWMKKKENAKT